MLRRKHDTRRALMGPYLRFISLARHCFRTLPLHQALFHLKVTLMDKKHFEATLNRLTASPVLPLRAATEEVSVVTAKLVLDTPDVCPYCKAKMRESTAVDVPVYICDDDRHVVPRPNKQN